MPGPLALLLLTLPAAQAGAPMVMAHPSLPPRPTTFLVDDKVSGGRVENFRALYVDPEAMASSLRPSKAGAADRRLSLPINNEFSSYAEISVEGQRIGLIDPMSNGAIHDVPAGTYAVSFKLQNGYVETRSVRAVAVSGPIVPGGRAAQAVVDSGQTPSWHTDARLGLQPAAPEPKAKAKAKRAQLSAKRIEITEMVQFTVGSAEIDAVSHGLLDEVAALILANPTLRRLDVQGHTDQTGDPGKNRALSQARAEAVVAYLVSKGVEASRLSATGFGPDRPLIAEDSEAAQAQGGEAARAANRRVELHVVELAPPAAPAEEAPAVVPTAN